MPQRPQVWVTEERRLCCLAAVMALGGCRGNVGAPAYATTRPRPLVAGDTAVPAEMVRVHTKALPWWTLAGTHHDFVLGFDQPPANRRAITGRHLGAIRSANVALSDDMFDAVRCAWKIVPMGDPRPCGDLRRSDAMTRAEPDIGRALSDLRTQAGGAGANAVVEVRCFASQPPRTRAGILWCEGVAVAADTRATTTASAPAPHAPIEHAPRTPGTRFVLHADASVGMLGSAPIVGTTLGLRYRPVELGFYILDLQRETIAPMEYGLVGLGATALARHALGRSRFDAIVGLSAVAVAPNGATNPDFDGLYAGFIGVAYQTPWRIVGAAQPFVQLRAGLAHGATIAHPVTSFVELHIGLSTPELR